MIKPSQDRIDKGMWWDRAWRLNKGCTKCSPGCDHCWSERETAMRSRQTNPKMRAQWDGVTGEDGRFTGEITTLTQNLLLPTKTKQPTVWAIWNDLFHEDIPDYYIDHVFRIMAHSAQHFFIICTKRPERMNAIIKDIYFRRALTMMPINARRVASPLDYPPLPNVMLLVTAENQEQADKRIPWLLKTPAAYRGVSIEPMLGQMEIGKYLPAVYSDGIRIFPNQKYLDWVVVGSESGAAKRYIPWTYIDAVVDQCITAQVPVFVKQVHLREATTLHPPRISLSKDMSEWVPSLRRREFPV